MKNNRLFRSGLAAFSAAALLSACESTGNYPGADGNGFNGARTSHYAPGDRLFKGDHLKDIHGAGVTAEESKLMELAAYRGIDGARLAHRLYNTSHAEELDGACEANVTAAKGETLWDIAEFCDVSLFVLSDYNPKVKSPSNELAGQQLFIPHASVINRPGFFEPVSTPLSPVDYRDDGLNSIPLSPIIKTSHLHHVEVGDTLTSIAVRHNVSAATLANLNPEIDWRYVPVGVSVKIPEQRIVNTAPRVSRAVKPLNDTKSTYLEVSSQTARPGSTVYLAARGLQPRTTIGLYRGANRRDLKFVGEFETNEFGELQADARVTLSAGLGGIIFAAVVPGGDYLYSPRVNVVKLKNDLSN